MNSKIGGYDYNFVDNLPHELVCKICLCPCCEAWKNACCGHVFCKSCLDQHLSTKSTCPLCRIKHFDSYPQLQTDQDIKELLIYCPNKERGCQWVGELSDIHKHNKDCKYCDIKCNKCDKIIQSNCKKSHLDTECPCYCPYCGTTAEREVISSKHKEKCDKFCLPCPNNCGKRIPRGNTYEHIKECPLEIIQCEYYDIGCTTRMPRKDQKKHNSEYFYRNYHVQLACRNQTTQAITTVASFATVHYSWLHLVLIFLGILILIMQVVIIPIYYSGKSDHKEMKLLEHIQQYHPTLLRSVFLNDLNEQSSHGNQVAPVVLKLSNFNENLKNQQRWYSSPFFAFEGGYQMCLGIHPIDISMYDRFLLSASLYLMQGPHDNALEHSGHQLLFKGIFTIELLNQLSDSDHIANEVILINGDICKECSEMSLDGEVVRRWGYPVLLPNDTFLHKNNTDYVINNSLYFRVSYKEPDPWYVWLFNWYYEYYLIPCIVEPIITVFSMIVAHLIIIIFQLHGEKYELLVYIAYLTALQCSKENSVFKGILWIICYFFDFFSFLVPEEMDPRKLKGFSFVFAVVMGSWMATVQLKLIWHVYGPGLSWICNFVYSLYTETYSSK